MYVNDIVEYILHLYTYYTIELLYKITCSIYNIVGWQESRCRACFQGRGRSCIIAGSQCSLFMFSLRPACWLVRSAGTGRQGALMSCSLHVKSHQYSGLGTSSHWQSSMAASAGETDCDLAWTQLAQKLGVYNII